MTHFMLENRFTASSGHLLSLKYNICVLEMSHGYMYAIRTYNHGELFSNFLAPISIAEVLKWLILCLSRDSLPVQAIYFP